MNKETKKSIVIYAIMIGAGLLLGMLLFGGGNNDSLNEHQQHEHDDHSHEGEHTHEDHDHGNDAGNNETDEYTCSMHPQVRQDEPGDCPICGMELIPVSDEDDHQEDDPFSFRMREAHSTWANVQTQRVEAKHAGATIRLTGKVAVDERKEQVITADFPGRIERLYANYTGKRVSQGEKLATIYSPEIMQAQQELIQAAANKETQPRLYESARQRLRLFGLTPDQVDHIIETGKASPTMDVYAGRQGILLRRDIAEGDYINTGQRLFAIADLDKVWVELDIYEKHLGLIREGQLAEVKLPAMAAAALEGEVEFVDPIVNPGTRSARARLTVINENNMLRPGMLANAIITTEETHQVVIPATAILWTGTTSVVYVKVHEDEGFSFEFRQIEIGPRTNETYIVHSGLEEGEEIAVNGVFAIDAAAQLRGHYSMMVSPPEQDLPEPFKGNLENLYNIYFDLKNALAADDPEQAREHGEKLQVSLEETGPHSLDGEHHMFWMEQYDAIEESLSDFSAADDIEGLRAHFEPLSEAFIETARTLGAIGQTFYVTFCPMYDDDRGAYWLSEFEEIKNPYFGSMMLSCGEVRETLREGIVHDQEQEMQEMEGHVH